MRATVAARLGLEGGFTKRGFHLRNLAAAVHAFRPESLDCDFVLSASGESALVLRCDFEPGSTTTDALDRAALFKENLLRADFAGHFDCMFLDHRDAGLRGMQSLSVLLPEDAALQTGQWLAVPMPLVDSAVDAFQYAQASGQEFVYRLRLRLRDGNVALARRLAPAVAYLNARGRRPDLETALRNAATTVRDDGWAATESFLVPQTAASRTWVENLLQRRLAATMPFFPVDSWVMHWDQDSRNGTSVEVQGARDASYFDLVLDTIAPSQHESPVLLAATRPAPTIDGDYVFVSYAHADADYGRRVIDLLTRSGVRVWYDDRIHAGTVWDEELERRIKDAGAVVVCLTTNYEHSRYCTRELKFADLKGKRILPISPKKMAWGAGLEMMFQELQVCVFEDGRGFATFHDALLAAAPRVFMASPMAHQAPATVGVDRAATFLF